MRPNSRRSSARTPTTTVPGGSDSKRNADGLRASTGAALLGSVFWLAYRRLYRPILGLTLLVGAEVATISYIESAGLLSDTAVFVWDVTASVLLLVLITAFGNYWYWKKYQRTLRVVRADGGDPASQEKLLRLKGGTSSAAVWLVSILLLVPVIWVVTQGIGANIEALEAEMEDQLFFVDWEATGPLTLSQLNLNESHERFTAQSADQQKCVRNEIKARARAAGDPESLDPTTVDLLPEKTWPRLDAEGKRIILAQAIVTKAFFECI